MAEEKCELHGLEAAVLIDTPVCFLLLRDTRFTAYLIELNFLCFKNHHRGKARIVLGVHFSLKGSYSKFY